MPQANKCRATKADGTPCGVPADRVGENGYCWMHDPANHSEIVEYARKGGKASKLEGLAEDDLPALNSPEAAELWLERVGRAVGSGRLGHNQGRTIGALIREWLKAHEIGKLADRIAELEQAAEADDAERKPRGA